MAGERAWAKAQVPGQWSKERLGSGQKRSHLGDFEWKA